MKVLACSDFQLGSGTEYGTPERPRLRDQAEALAHIAQLARETGAVVLFLGDACQHRRPGIDELLVFGRWVAGVYDVHLLAGNHDVRGPGLPTVLDLFGESGLNVWTKPGVHIVQLPGERPVAFAFLPWAHPGPLRAALGPSDPPEHADALLKVAEGLRAGVEATAPGAYAVLCTHFALSGMSIPSGLLTSELVGEPVLDTHALLAQDWNVVLSGHVHAPGIVEAPGRQAVSLGSPYVCDFGEAESEHGVWLLDTERDYLEHLPVPDRPFMTLYLTVPSDGRWGTPAPGSLEGAVVRARVQATEEQAARLDVGELRRILYGLGAHKVYAVQLDVQRSTRARAEGIAEDTEPLEALDLWLSAVEASSPERLRDLTRRYLEEDAA